MKKKIALSLLICLFLTACAAPPIPPTPSEAEIATLVAVQLTSLPSQTLPPSATPQPPTQPAATQEPSPTDTQEAPATPTLPASLQDQLGEPSWVERFDSSTSFGMNSDGYEDDYTRIQVSGGALELSSKTTLGALGWRTGGPKTAQKSYVEGLFNSGNCSGRDRYGLVLRSPDFIDGYMFTVTCGGAYSFGYWKNDAYTDLRSAGDTPNLLTGANQNNRLGVNADGQRLSLYVNGSKLFELDDSAFGEGGHSGAVVAGVDSSSYTVRLLELAFWNLP